MVIVVRFLVQTLQVDSGALAHLVHGRTAAGLSATAVAVIAALIGAGGAIVGGLVGGWFALLAAHRQWSRDREDRRSDQSRQAALEIAEASNLLEEAFLARAVERISGDELTRAFNTFSQIASMRSIAIIDPQIRKRVRDHQLLGFAYMTFSHEPEKLSPYADRLRVHGEAMTAAIEAYYNGKLLPPYQSIPLASTDQILAWKPTPPPPPNAAERVSRWKSWARNH
jgi:hypothetical protein